MSMTSKIERNTRPIRGLVLAAFIAVAMLFGGRSAVGADICWQSGVSPDGHHYRVFYVPYDTIKMMTAKVPHRYLAIAAAVPGMIFAADDVPCTRIPWEHEIKHIDGWEHDASGNWTEKHAVAFSEADAHPQTWTIVETETGLEAVRESSVAALPADAQ
jgi:hypothetical protein